MTPTTNTKPRRVAFLAVDPQVDFCEGGLLAVPGGSAVAGAIADELAEYRDEYDLTVVTSDWHITPGDHFTEFPVHCVANTPGAGLHPALVDTEFDVTIHKGQYAGDPSGFDGHEVLADEDERGRSLEAVLRDAGITDIVVGGLVTDICVRATVLDALKRDFDVELRTDLIQALDEANGIATLASLDTLGVVLTERNTAGIVVPA